jgi:hypothetical protein
MRKTVTVDLLLMFGLSLIVLSCYSKSAEQNASKATDSVRNSTYSVVLPTETELRETTSVPGVFAVYKILSAQLEQRNPNKFALRFNVRMTNNNNIGALLDSGEFRLVVDGVSQRPTSPPASEMVAPHSEKERIVEFVIPDKTRTVALKIGEAGEGEWPIRISLKVGSPQ